MLKISGVALELLFFFGAAVLFGLFVVSMLLAPAIIFFICCWPILTRMYFRAIAPEQPSMSQSLLCALKTWAILLLVIFAVMQVIQPIYYYSSHYWSPETYATWARIRKERGFEISAFSDRILTSIWYQITLTAFVAHHFSGRQVRGVSRRITESLLFIAIGVLGHAVLMAENIVQWLSEGKLVTIPIAIASHVANDIAETIELIMKSFYRPSDVLAWVKARYVESNGELPLLMKEMPKGMWLAALAAAISWSR